MLAQRSLKTILCRSASAVPASVADAAKADKRSVADEPVASSSPTVADHRRTLFRAISTMTPLERSACVIPHPILDGSQRGWDNEEAFCRDVHLETLLGGNSNAAFVVRFHNAGGLTPCDEKNIPRPLLLKVYGTAMQKIVDRSADVRGSLVASSVALGPGIVALFDWGRLEIFLPGYSNFTTSQWMSASEPWFLRSTATALRTLHDRCSALPAAQAGDSSRASLDLHLFRFLGCFSEASQAAKAQDDHVQQFIAECESEIKWLLDRCEAIGDPLVFSHSDSNPSNLLWKKVTTPNTPSSATFSSMRVSIGGGAEPTSTFQRSCSSSSLGGEAMELYLIDYEYCGWNFPFFDLGNVVCEMDYDYEDSHGVPTTDPVQCQHWPDEDEWKSDHVFHGFIKPIAEEHKHLGEHYHTPRLAKNILSRIRDKERGDNKSDDQDLASHIVENFVAPFFGVPSSALTVNHHYRRLALGMLASNLKWGVWGCAVCSHEATRGKDASTIILPRGSSGLDYAAYSESRLQDYEALKTFLVEEGLL